MEILCLGGSPRISDVRSRECILRAIDISSDLDSYIRGLNFAEVSLTSTEILEGAALLSARNQGARVNYLPLAQWLSSRDSSCFEKVDGILISSPVYNGDKSSLLHPLFQEARKEGFFNWKTIAALSAGSSRNGGQETTNLHVLSEASHLGALVVGQGATAIAEEKDSVTNDRIGLESAFKEGKVLADAVEILSSPKNTAGAMVHVGIVLSMDNDNRWLYRRVKSLVEGAEDSRTRFTIVNIVEDGLQNELWRYDGVIFAGLNAIDDKRVANKYYEFTERNVFELTHIPVTSLTLSEVGAMSNPHFSLQVMNSYLRQQAILCPPIHEIELGQDCFKSAKGGLEGFLSVVRHVAAVNPKERNYRTETRLRP